jgi:NTE family protein
MKALVLSGGGLFGAWQAGAWSALAREFEPDLIVGASIGSLNGYLIACEVSPEEILGMWCDAEFRNLGDLHGTLRRITSRYTLRRPFAVAVTDILTMKVRTYRDGEVSWRHLAASCAVPPVYAPVRLDGRWYTDGGLTNPLPVWVATEAGASEVEALHVLGKFPAPLLQPFVEGFRWMFGHHPVVPGGVTVRVREPSERLGGLKQTLWGTQADIERWLELGALDLQKPFPL